MPKKSVLILLGSGSDRSVMQACADVLAEFKVGFEMTVASAHRSPERALGLVKDAKARGVKVVVCAAGMAAHLAGTAAAHTSLPVIGVPMNSGPLSGLDALLSTVQMPPGVPVATVSVGDAGAQNAAYLAMRILALSDPGLSRKLKTHASRMKKKVEKAAKEVEKDSS